MDVWLSDINKYEPIDEKDKYAREHIDELSHKIIQQIMKLHIEIFKGEKTVAERYVAQAVKKLWHDIVGRIDYESTHLFNELKVKPSKLFKRKNKDEYYWKQQELSEDLIFDDYWKQVAFYYKCTGKKPFLSLVNEDDYMILDDITVTDVSRPTELAIEFVPSGFSLSVVIKNIGEYEAIDLVWSLNITGGILGLINTSLDGDADNLSAGDELEISLPLLIGLGPLMIVATASAANADEVTETWEGFIFLIFIF